VTLELPPLDDLRFQALVSQARKRIALRCPEWDEHNVSDPGITLIEQFASMIEMLGYRIDRIPERVHVALLRLLDIELAPPVAATADLELRLAGPAEREVTIPAYETEVTTVAGPGEEPIAFQVSETFVIRPLRPLAVAFRRAGRVQPLAVRQGVCRPTGPDRVAFGADPGPDDGLYLGFAEPLDRLLLRISVDASKAWGAGIDPSEPPLRWEVSARASDVAAPQEREGWAAAKLIRDTTLGFNAGGGEIELQLPDSTASVQVGTESRHWLRCRLAEDGQPDRRYRRPPLIDSITAHVIGALVPAEHAVRVMNEELGVSDGTPAQTFHVRQRPALEPSSREGLLEVREQGSADWVPWTAVESFSDSDANDRHCRFDPASGRIELGPAILAPGKGWEQHGAVPPKGATLRIAGYQHGGGARGNVAKETLRVLRRGIPGVASVRNEAPARGGVDAETVELGRQRAELQLRTRDRAVTADDFEFLAGEASPRVMRARCGRPAVGHAIPVYVLPAVPEAFPDPPRALTFEELTPEKEMLAEVREYLEERRVLGTSVDVQPVRLRGVQVAVDALVDRFADPLLVERDIRRALYRYLNPFGASLAGDAEGWEFGRAVTDGDLRAVIYAVPRVSRILLLRIYETDPARRDVLPRRAGTTIVIGPDELACSGTHAVNCSREP
jgi:predicted phage baseplate assembly protein